jgi:mannose-1-phosphate guanylyltransferase
MERLPEAATVPGRFGWDDVGTLAAYAEVGPAAAPIEVSASGNVVIGAKRLVAVVGADDLVIVETDDALLICRRGESQRVREVVQVLEKQGRDELL